VPSSAWAAAARSASLLAWPPAAAVSSHRCRAHVGEPDPGLGDRAVGTADQRGHADGRPRLRGAMELLVAETSPGSQLGYPDPGQDFVWFQARGQVVHEEVSRGDLTFAARAPGDQRGIEHQCHRGQVTRRVGVDQCAAEGARCRMAGSATVLAPWASSPQVRPREGRG